MHHDLKTVPKQFKPVFEGKMKAIVRENDRDYQIGDTVTLNEGWQGLNGFEPTCALVSARISYIDDFGCQHGYVNLSLDDVGMLIVE
jgi:hypothetical protein